MLRGRYGYGWMIVAWVLMTVFAIAIALWFGRILATLVAEA
jgi:hypothetical protein